MPLLQGFILVTILATRSTAIDHEIFIAPLHGMDVHNKHRNQYLVSFERAYTLEEHFRFIGRNLSSSPQFRRFSFGYLVALDDQTRDEQVRRDPGVWVVETSRPGEAIEAEDVTLIADSEAAL